MKQVLQSLKSGKTEIVDVPIPALKKGHILIKSTKSLISVGTERMLVDFGKASLLNKSRQQPEKVKEVLNKIKSDGILTTYDAVKTKLETPVQIGYSNYGIVIESDVQLYKPGDRVISNGPHAEVVCVPKNLCAKVPDNVSDDTASFTVLSSISLQSVRLINPSIGETIVVIGLGLVGLLTIQILKANGCRVIGADYNEDRCMLSSGYGAETINLSKKQNLTAFSKEMTNGVGVDGVVIAAATSSNEPINQAADICRQRGRIVLVGSVGLNIDRNKFYEKEISFQVSSSYGPGRYDSSYEEKGQDYPLGFVRWTEQRNFEAVLNLMNDGLLSIDKLISHRFMIDEAEKAYSLINDESSLGILFDYRSNNKKEKNDFPNFQIINSATKDHIANNSVNVGFIGSGNYASRVLIPAFKSSGSVLKTIGSHNGFTGNTAAKKFGFNQVTTNIQSIIDDPDINAIVIATRHDSHAQLVINSLKKDKHVFVEKPLCISNEELKTIIKFFSSRKNNDYPVLTVGFNRRYSPHVLKIKSLLERNVDPISVVVNVNAGFIPKDHWLVDLDIGGGRIVGEACHFIDLMRFIVGSEIINYSIHKMNTSSPETCTINCEFKDGSIGTIHYFSNGNKILSKERLEIFAGGRILHLDNFKKLIGYGWSDFNKMNLWRQDKGQRNCVNQFINSVQTNQNPISLNEILEVARISIDLQKM